MSIAEIAVKRPLLILVIFTVLILFGLECYHSLNYNLLPKMEVPTVTVSTVYAGASASEVESSVTKKLEDKFASVEGLDKITSKSQEGVSQVVIAFKSGTNIDEAEADIQRKADQAQNDLPKDIDKPLVNKVNLEEAPVVKAGVTSTLAPRALYDLVDKQLRPILQNVSGVGQVNIIGGDEREIQVNVDQHKLNAYGITINQVTDAVNYANQSFPAGSIETQNQQVTIQYDANVTSVAQIRDLIVVQRPGGGSVYLKDVAEVVDATAKATAINHINGLPSIGIQIVKQSDANAVNVSRDVKKAFATLEKQYQDSKVKFTISSDQSTYTLRSADAVMEDLVLAVIIVGIVMLAFLHSFRSSMFVMVALPSSMIPTFIAMYVMGFSLNLMTLMALSLVVGILVDDSIVVLENIYRHLEAGTDRKQAALDGRNEIGFTAMAITLVDVVVFLPLALSGGIIGMILREFSLVVVISTLMSLFVSFTVTPMLASRFGRLEHLTKDTWWGRVNLGFEHIIDVVKVNYGKLLRVSLHKKRYLLSGVIILIIGSIMLVVKGFVGAAFIPSGDQGELMINLELSPDASIYQTNMLTRQVEKQVLARPEVDKVFSSIGFLTGGVAGTGNNSNRAELTVTLVDAKKRTMTAEEFGIMMQRELTASVPGAKITASPTSITGNASAAPIQIAVKGVNLKDVRSVAEQYMKIVATVPGTQFVQLSVKDPKPQVEVKLDREKMTLLGLNASQVGGALQNAFSGNDKSKFKQSGNEYNILVSFDKFNRSDISNVRNLSFTNNDGQSFVLSQFAEVREGTGESVLERSDRLNSITVNANVAGRPTGTVATEIKEKVAGVKLPEGVSIEYLGDVKNQGDAFGSLGLALITAILLVYLIMVALYESVIYPFVVLFSIPVALIGALLALALSMETLNIFSIIGVIMLLGLVSKNAILIVDFTNHLKEKGTKVEDALVEAGEERLRPILMTTLAMILGMLPIAMARGAGSEVKNGMAWVIIGGLTSSMILTLFVVPAMYLIIDKLKMRLQKKKQPAYHEVHS
ncbi:efflux RND transporter permease subunit [Chitinophaga sancti]|uniref:Efflux RND transporter permease subunit n=1 Tax=Chitinophaga sancti TaxID=1004 RepID=A0A1K1S501_9BACT|nr:efflux RND transporter permease subunit [Chitinophaga sancti]WQD63747.1 efflux RND transporter permease subunit [Chitinophaga sancti]WQG90628.1 efflux RND transporter permease subunit [Chitinophaga sancti]SFW79101.1 hydrophobic/amphiphilic exporter-1, HAE1 family [Chitinophaga sancti]